MRGRWVSPEVSPPNHAARPWRSQPEANDSCWGSPPRGTEADNAVLEVLNEILFGGDASRADACISIAKRLWSIPFVPTLREPGLYEIGVDCRPGRRAEESASLLESIFEDITVRGVTDEEVLRARNRIETRFFEASRQRKAERKHLDIGMWSLETPTFFSNVPVDWLR